ncbi:MAG TPA: aldehyde dehydrogenase family protein [Myxococcota bacterium]|nr:aldehyde dehydrogenase family protein [Myxococcota bacterium]
MNTKNIVDIHRTLVQSHAMRRPESLVDRKKPLRQLRLALLTEEPRIYQAVKRDLGRPQFETFVAELAFIKKEIDFALRNIDDWARPRLVKTPMIFQPGSAFIEPTPKGVVLIIGTWNYPFQVSLVPLVSAIAAGNCAVVKPSEMAHESAQVIADIVNQYLDPNCFRAIGGGVETAKYLLDLPFDHIFYTGSTLVGKEIMAKAARHLTPVTLELGGKSPAIVDKDCDLSLAVKRILWGKCLNAGQTCIAPDYVLLHSEHTTSFVAHAKKHLQAMFGDSIIKSQSYARIVNERHFDRLVSYLSQGKVVLGGRYDRAEKFIEPTILMDAPPDAPVMVDEIFGPILLVIPVTDLSEAIAFINERPHPLALYIFSKDKRNIRQVLDRTISGGVAINEVLSQVAITELPFGGVRYSGIGGYHGAFGFETFSHMRAIYKRSNFLDNPLRYAPYTERKLKLAKTLL